MAQLNIDELRTKTAAEIVVIARETFNGVELQGNKAQLLAQIKRLSDAAQQEAADEAPLTKDVVLEHLRQGAVSKATPSTKLVLNKATGMVFRNHEGLHPNPNLVPYAKTPVIVIHKGKQAVMDPMYAKELFPAGEVDIVPLDENLNAAG